MSANPYPPEILDEDDDNGTMPENVEALAEAVIGHRIVAVEKKETSSRRYGIGDTQLILTLDNGTRVELVDSKDCCAYTELKAFLLHPDKVDHIITGVGTTDEYETWHIFADMGDVLELSVAWSSGNPFYYSYGFQINVVPVEDAA
ncbi:DUF7448 domain-containing protein [Rhodococcus ruber]|uniref:DUF7448 domain-containing protein n=1 Tax=Rhodococcus ruber TaxID=1830 RepID=A0A098BL64_9NOCA|nr:hypothetical protein [Rhodococcus ruber]MCZ4506352.1 hypothetical protein [Rhodococcus ruber]MCZ4533703.1 hypothetical protein [Rhodococcus ruber]CDZ88947.1 conserved hypothetical protein [Rhodococcus ruber]